ncbi:MULTISPECIES: phage major capsid protein [Rhodopseudomonas]|uniref:Capsid protein n=1 Tax=Rhodopseudomonas palustris TaxID=1076 RepID=A0A0D7EPP9_RHOPL|nr:MULTISPECIES: phage major capsid protein [Rhodopseudomonas]KIZ41437.1 capsid protein [Rhodopseudomonas palustris]MDF3810060.1 phage major capsid protein [Rhodopseudomonas sp. BAL398]WOK18737.1 phage major capsid protein [Rhodopseudomonas sp. BAL398]
MQHVSKQALLRGAIELKEGDLDPAAIVQKALDDLQKSVDDRLKAVEGKGIDPKLQAQIDAIQAKLNRPGTGTEEKEADVVEKKAFDTYVRRGREGLTADEVKSLRVSDDTAGGFLAPDAFQAELDRNVVLFSPVRSVARVLPTGAPAVLWPKRTGGMTGAWVGETQARPETTVTFGQNRYTVCELAAYVDVSNAMLEDSAFDVGQLLAFEFAEEFGHLEGVAFVNGASPLAPSGFMQDPNIAYTPGTDASLVKGDGLIDLYHAIKAPYRANAVWGMNSATLGAIRKLKDTQGNYLVAMQGINNAPVTTLLGRPILELPDLPDVGSGAFPIVFGDFSQGYRIFDRISLSILRDPYSQATNGMTRFHGRRRVAGGVGKAEAIRKLKIATS